MKQFHRNVAILLCAVLLLLVSVSIGTSQARFVNAVSWHGVYIPETVSVKSDRLCEGGQTVVLADWYLDDGETSREYVISLKAEEGVAQGNMSCQTPDSSLIRASVDADGVIVDEGESIVMLSLKLKDAALSLKKKTTVSVVVSWTDIDRGTVLWADFSCTLIPAEKEETEPATEAPAEEETEVPTEEATEAPTEEVTESPTEEATEEVTETQATESTDAEQTATENAEESPAAVAAEEQIRETDLSVAAETEEPGEPVETDEPTEEPSETSEPTEEPSETSEPTEEPSETSEPTEEPSETSEPTEEPSETSEPTEEPSETSEPTEPETEPVIPEGSVEIIQYTENIAWSEWFGMQIAVPDDVSYLEVFYNGSDFPEGTRFILNDGQELLPENAQTFIIPANGRSVELLLINMADVSEEDQQEHIEIMVTANGSDGTEYSVDFVQINATRKALEFPKETSYAVLSSTDSMKIACTWDASDVICKVERLVRNEGGGVSWTEGEYGLAVQIPQNYDPENEQMFTISNESGNAPAGCYRITVRREFEGMVISEKRILFFIHY